MLGFAPLADLPLAAIEGGELPAYVEQIIYAATHPFITEPDDAPENTYFESRLKTPLVFERSILNGDSVGAAASIGFGSIELENSDGFYDSIIQNHAIDGRRVTLKLGDPRPDFPYAAFGTIFDGAASGWTPTEAGIKVLLRDWSYELEVPIARHYYGGTGGADGTADMTGKPIQQCWGPCSNIPLTLVDPATLLYQAHDGPMKGVDAVRDRGVVLTPDTQYTVDLAAGTITLLQNPAGDITADVRGSNSGDVYVETTADIVKRIIAESAGWDDADYDLDSFDALNDLQPATVNYFVSDDVSIARVIDDLLDGIGGYRSFSRTGLLQVGRVSLPPAGEVQAIFTKDEILDVKMIDPPSSYYPPSWRQRVGYQRNWKVMTNDLASGVSAADRVFLSQEYRYGEAHDNAVKVSFLLAQDAPPKAAHFAYRVDAEEEALRLLALFSAPRSFLRFTVKTQPFTIDIGATVFGQYPRWNLKNGKSMFVLGVRDDGPGNECTLSVFL
jgi:hypothetical protein